MSFPTFHYFLPHFISARRMLFSQQWTLTQVFQANECFQLHIHREKDKANKYLQKEAENYSEIGLGIARWTMWPVLSTYKISRQNCKANFIEPWEAITWSYCGEEKEFPSAQETGVNGHMCCSCGRNSFEKAIKQRYLATNMKQQILQSAGQLVRWTRTAAAGQGLCSTGLFRVGGTSSELMQLIAFVTQRPGGKPYKGGTRGYKRTV